MGRSAKTKAARRAERKVRAELERSGVADRVRMAYLGLRREDVQAEINERIASTAPWAEQVPVLELARHVLERCGYDLTGVEISVQMLPGRTVLADGEPRQLPPRAIFMADVDRVSLEAAESAAGARRTLSMQAAAPLN